MNVVYVKPESDAGDLVGTDSEARDSADVQQSVANAETAWVAHRARVWELMSEGLMTEAEGEHLCSERHKAAWLRQYFGKLSRWYLQARQQ